jgi:hypothetical protein
MLASRTAWLASAKFVIEKQHGGMCRRVRCALTPLYISPLVESPRPQLLYFRLAYFETAYFIALHSKSLADEKFF